MADKKEIRKLTFDDIIAKRLQKQSDEHKLKEIEVPSLEGTLTFRKPSYKQIIEALNSINDDVSSVVAAYKKLIYDCCPVFQNGELIKKLKLTDPYDVVEELLELKEVRAIGDMLCDFESIKTIEEEIKN